jgi:hypothetical protein
MMKVAIRTPSLPKQRCKDEHLIHQSMGQWNIQDRFDQSIRGLFAKTI